MATSSDPSAASRAPAEAILRRASSADLPTLASIHRRAFFAAMPQMPVLHTPAEDVVFYSATVFPRCEIWVAEINGDTIGFISNRADWIDHLYILPEYQKRGIGSALLGIPKQTNRSLRLWTFQCNSGARRFYERHGFRIERETDGRDNDERQPDVLYVWRRDE